MSGTGVGRGRGWLNLNKNQNAGDIRPGPAVSPGLNTGSLTDNTQFANVNEFSDLINKVKQLNVNDDGIKFNQKMKYIIDNWMQGCPTTGEVEGSYDAMHKAALHDPDFASKLVLMVSSRTFIQQDIHSKNIRLMFVRKLQDSYEARTQMQQTDPVAFLTNIQMMGEFYNKARLCSGKQIAFIALPLISYLEMLLDSAQPQDLKLFTAQLYLNGASLKGEAPERLAEVLNKVRTVLAADSSVGRDGRLWLLLALEVAGNRFALLPSEVHNFYQEQLGDVAMASFQGTHGALSVQTAHNSKSLDGYQSNVNVLQVSTSTSPSDAGDQPPVVNDLTTSSGFASSDSSAQSAKTGRPILGSGARLNRRREDAGGEAWRGGGGGDGWGGRKAAAAAGGWEKKPPRSGSKGWEHDDRFDTDYS